jgi:exopolysaccharide production protein ExoQ
LTRTGQFIPSRGARAGTLQLAVGEDHLAWALCFFSFFMLLLVSWSMSFGLTMASVLMFMLPWAAVIARQPHLVLRGLIANSALFALPALALMSTVWSHYPSWTLRAGTQYLVTVVVAVIAGSCIKPRILLSALLSALALVAVLSVIDGSVQPMGVSRQPVLVGLFGSKNYFAFCVSLLLLTAVAVAFDRSQPLTFRAIAIGAAISAPPLLAYANSTGATIVSAAALAIVFTLYLTIHLSPLVRATITVFVLFVLANIGIIGSFYANDFPELVTYFGKDTTLTGRTYFWHIALAAIEADPILGAGYQAYWQAGNWGAEELWRWSGIRSKVGFHFHNIYLQVAVDLGFMGLSILVATLLVIMMRILIVLVSGRPRREQLFAISVFTFMLLRSPIEVDSFFQFDFGSIMLCLTWIYLGRAPAVYLRRAPAVKV